MLLAAAVAQRDRVLAELTDDELAHVARRVWTELIDKLASGAPYRLRRGTEL